MAIAEQVSTRSTCNRKHVGTVIVRDKVIANSGINTIYYEEFYRDERISRYAEEAGELFREVIDNVETPGQLTGRCAESSAIF